MAEGGNASLLGDGQRLYAFLDEGGNFDFSPGGTRYFTVTSVSLYRPFTMFQPLMELKYDLLDQGLDIESFHATDDRQHVRDRVFDILLRHLDHLRINSLVVEKCKAEPSIRQPERFYPMMLGQLMNHLLDSVDFATVPQVIVVTDRIPIRRKRRSVEKAVKTHLSAHLRHHTPYRLLHHSSMSSLGLQVADYCNWAIYRKWNSSDRRSYEHIKDVIKSELNVFAERDTRYY